MCPSHRPRSGASPANLPSSLGDDVALGSSVDRGRPTRCRAPREAIGTPRRRSRGRCPVAGSDALVLAKKQQPPNRGRRLPQLPLCRVVPREYLGVPGRGPKPHRQRHSAVKASSELTRVMPSVLAMAPMVPAPAEAAGRARLRASTPPQQPVLHLAPLQQPLRVPGQAVRTGERRTAVALP